MTKQTTPEITKKSTKMNFSPKQATINFLLSFASAYQVTTTSNGQICDFVLN